MIVGLLAFGCQNKKAAQNSSSESPKVVAPGENAEKAPPLKEGEELISDCGHGENGAQCEQGQTEGKAVTGGTKLYGAAIASELPAVAFSALVKDPESYVGKDVVITGHVRAACKKKGCWMELAESAQAGQGARVVFKDYSFFVPMDSAGSSARLQGTVKLTRVAAKQVAHYEEEGATFAKKFDDGTAREVRIVASGVELTSSSL